MYSDHVQDIIGVVVLLHSPLEYLIVIGQMPFCSHIFLYNDCKTVPGNQYPNASFMSLVCSLSFTKLNFNFNQYFNISYPFIH